MLSTFELNTTNKFLIKKKSQRHIVPLIVRRNARGKRSTKTVSVPSHSPRKNCIYIVSIYHSYFGTISISEYRTIFFVFSLLCIYYRVDPNVSTNTVKGKMCLRTILHKCCTKWHYKVSNDVWKADIIKTHKIKCRWWFAWPCCRAGQSRDWYKISPSSCVCPLYFNYPARQDQSNKNDKLAENEWKIGGIHKHGRLS